MTKPLPSLYFNEALYVILRSSYDAYNSVFFLCCRIPVSYTHLDVYKRQHLPSAMVNNTILFSCFFINGLLTLQYWPVIGQNWEFIRSHGQFTKIKCSFAYKKNTPFLALSFLKFKLHHVFLYIIMSILIPYLYKLVIIKGDFPPYKISNFGPTLYLRFCNFTSQFFNLS